MVTRHQHHPEPDTVEAQNRLPILPHEDALRAVRLELAGHDVVCELLAERRAAAEDEDTTV